MLLFKPNRNLYLRFKSVFLLVDLSLKRIRVSLGIIKRWIVLLPRFLISQPQLPIMSVVPTYYKRLALRLQLFLKLVREFTVHQVEI